MPGKTLAIRARQGGPDHTVQSVPHTWTAQHWSTTVGCRHSSRTEPGPNLPGRNRNEYPAPQSSIARRGGAPWCHPCSPMRAPSPQLWGTTSPVTASTGSGYNARKSAKTRRGASISPRRVRPRSPGRLRDTPRSCQHRRRRGADRHTSAASRAVRSHRPADPGLGVFRRGRPGG